MTGIGCFFFFPSADCVHLLCAVKNWLLKLITLLGQPLTQHGTLNNITDVAEIGGFSYLVEGQEHFISFWPLNKNMPFIISFLFWDRERERECGIEAFVNELTPSGVAYKDLGQPLWAGF